MWASEHRKGMDMNKPVEPLRAAAPAPVLNAVKLMYAAAAVSIASLVVIALWLWMARENGQGRNWARILATVLFGPGDAGADQAVRVLQAARPRARLGKIAADAR